MVRDDVVAGNVVRQRQIGKFLGERYKNNAVMWFPGGDSAPGKYDAVWVAMAKGLKDGSSLGWRPQVAQRAELN